MSHPDAHEVSRWESIRRSLNETKEADRKEEQFRRQVIGLLGELLQRTESIEKRLHKLEQG